MFEKCNSHGILKECWVTVKIYRVNHVIKFLIHWFQKSFRLIKIFYTRTAQVKSIQLNFSMLTDKALITE